MKLSLPHPSGSCARGSLRGPLPLESQEAGLPGNRSLKDCLAGKGGRILLLLAVLLSVAVPARAQLSDSQMVESYTQYVPVAVDLGLTLTGVKAENCFVDRLIAAGLGYVSEIIVVNAVLKNVVHEMRPDGSTDNSFPSGHTTTAFLGAELVRHEYGWGWGLGAYAIATSVGVMRVVHDRHWPVDVMAGAVCGILCANIGYWTLEPTKSLFGIKTGHEKEVKLSFTPVYEPHSKAVCLGLSCTF